MHDDANATPTRRCEKCHQPRPLEAFQHRLERYADICVRCLKAMGYQLEGKA